MRAIHAQFAFRARRAFTLIEFVIVSVMIAMIASMAIPRLANGSVAAAENTLKADVMMLSKAILIYAAEHGNNFPGPTGLKVADQLTTYSDGTGRTASARSGAYQFGPYLAAIPALPSGTNAGRNGIIIDNVNSPPKSRPATPAGWVYNPTTGEIRPNEGAGGGVADVQAELGGGADLGGAALGG
ncbi:MAG: type II secretion system protein [Phycisphaerae bacterium]